MASFRYDHVHLRSPDPETTAAFYERMFGAEVIRSVQSDGSARVDLDLCGLKVFIAPVREDRTGSPPSSPYQGLEHLGLAVEGIDQAVAELKAKGAVFELEPNTVRPGVRIAFLRGPENVSIELLERSAA